MSTLANVRDWPKDQVLAKVSNTKWRRTWPKDQEVKMGARRRYSQCIYTIEDNGATGVIVRKENKENNRSTKTGQ